MLSSLRGMSGIRFARLPISRQFDRGIRSLAQLQFRDDLDAYYVSQKERVIGAIRTESYNNEIRIDNLQHGLMALLKYQEFERSDRQNAPTPRKAQSMQPAAAH